MASVYKNILPKRTLIRKEVFSILDSKIQYQKFIVNEAMKGFDIEQEGLSDETPVMDYGMFELIESSNRNLHLLLFLRDKLEDWNATQVFDLITNNKYLEYSEDEIAISLQPKRGVDISSGQQAAAR